MEFPLNAHVECTDGVCGHSEFVLINPVVDQVTHLVVNEDAAPNTEYKDVILPLSTLAAMGKTHKDTVFLNIDKHQIRSVPTFPLTRHWS